MEEIYMCHYLFCPSYKDRKFYTKKQSCPGCGGMMESYRENEERITKMIDDVEKDGGVIEARIADGGIVRIEGGEYIIPVIIREGRGGNLKSLREEFGSEDI